ncbi:MAG: phosphoribosylanthranilate isomerase [Clostridium sp.]|jgi:phosphoribosylanthranilate isomerase|nr:phosphoribosylanthranilate isomerase [Clostridium sp.]
MTGVKICGLRRKEDIEYVNRYMPQFVGFVFAESKRRVTKEWAKELRDGLLPSIRAVGVFVNEDMEKVVDIVKYTRLDCVQLHGDETPEYIEQLMESIKDNEGKKIEIWKGIRVKNEDSLRRMSEYSVNAFILDTYVEGSYGGSGSVFDWHLAAFASEYGKIILAGGLNPQNVKEAVERVKPFAVDVSSGVETDGFKDEAKIKEFIRKVRQC